MCSRRLRLPTILACGVCVVVLAGCGRFASADRAGEPNEVGTASSVPVPMPENVEPQVTAREAPDGTEPVPAQPTEGGRTQTAPAGSGEATVDERGRVANAASAVTDGLEVEVVAEDGPRYGSRPLFRVQVTLRNRSDRTRYYFLGQGNFAALTDAAGDVVWTSTACNETLDTYEIYGGAAPLEPGEEVSAVVPYPAPNASDDSECDLPDGRYTLHGLFPVCPDEAVEETANPGTYSCPEETVQQHASGALPVVFGDG